MGGLEVAVVQLPSDCTTDSRFAVLGAISGQANAATGKGNLQKASRNAAYGVQHGGNGDDGDTE